MSMLTKLLFKDRGGLTHNKRGKQTVDDGPACQN